MLQTKINKLPTTNYQLQTGRGFSLVEVILSSALFIIIATTFVGAYLYGQESTALSGSRARAVLLAQESLEAARNISNADFANLTDGTYGLIASGGTYALSGSSDVTDIFTREVAISTLDTNRKEVTSTVSWQQNAQRTGIVTLVTRFTNWVASSNAFNGVIRATEYYVSEANFSGTTYNLTLNQDLEANYFVIVQGSDGDGVDNNGDRGPDENYIILSSDPFGTGDLPASAGTDVLSFVRNAAVSSWVGVVTVVECMDECDTNGFELLSVENLSHNATPTSGSDTSAVAWSDIDQTMLIGGFNGSGCTTVSSVTSGHKNCHVRIYPSATDTIEWERSSTKTTLTNTTTSVMVVEWGSQWLVQRVNVTGNNGGNGANATGEYDTASITSIARDNTWVWGTGWTADQGIGDASEGTLITLGDGVSQNTTESTVAVGQEYKDSRSFEVYALTHPSLMVDYRFKPDGDTNVLTYDATVDAATTTNARMALMYNGQNGTGNAYPRPLFSARYVAEGTVRAERRRGGQSWPAWIQGIDFSGIIIGGGSIDTESPVVTAIGNNPAELLVGASYSDLGATVTDNVDSGLGYSITLDGVPVVSVSIDTSSPGSYTVGYTATDNAGNVGSATRIVNVSAISSQADDLAIDVSVSSIGGGGNKELKDITLQNTGTSDIIIDKITLTWDNGNLIEEIKIDGTKVWRHNNEGTPDGKQPSGTELDIVDFTLTQGGGVLDIDKFKFNGNMSGATISITFTMSDGSTKFTGNFTP